METWGNGWHRRAKGSRRAGAEVRGKGGAEEGRARAPFTLLSVHFPPPPSPPHPPSLPSLHLRSTFLQSPSLPSLHL
eukprot:4327174-Pyramimonas_sp.AAC.1